MAKCESSTVVIAEGFLMLHDKETVRNMDARFFVREDYATLKRRRQERHGYVRPDTLLYL